MPVLITIMLPDGSRRRQCASSDYPQFAARGFILATESGAALPSAARHVPSVPQTRGRPRGAPAKDKARRPPLGPQTGPGVPEMDGTGEPAALPPLASPASNRV